VTAAVITRTSSITGRRVPLLSLDPALGEAIGAADSNLALRSLTVPTIEVEKGLWDPPDTERDGGLGLLIVDGLVGRQLCLAGSRSFGPLGPGDLLRPSLEDVVSFATVRFEVLIAGRIAVLDRAFLARAGASRR